MGIVVPALCIGMIIAAAYLFHRYLSGKDQHSPNILVIEMHINILGNACFFFCCCLFGFSFGFLIQI